LVLAELKRRFPYPERLRSFLATTTLTDLDALQDLVSTDIPDLVADGFDVASVVENERNNTVYAARSGSVVIPAGQRRVEVDVDVLEDAVRERDETFVLRLTGSSNAPLSSDTAAEATIEAND
jgi:hypothetical protein